MPIPEVKTVSEIMTRDVLQNESSCTFIDYQIHIKTRMNI